ncbi:unnamed protein product [Lota lota]
MKEMCRWPGLREAVQGEASDNVCSNFEHYLEVVHAGVPAHPRQGKVPRLVHPGRTFDIGVRGNPCAPRASAFK